MSTIGLNYVAHLFDAPGTVLRQTRSISVVIPAYNAERWIGRAIQSTLNQTVRPSEVIVVDDGSTDGTPQAIHECGEAVRCSHQQNAGPGAARNLGVDMARSEWVAFLDGDDEWLPHKTESQFRVLDENPDLKWCSSAYEKVSNGTTTIRSLPRNMEEKLACRSRLSFFSAWMQGVGFGTPGFIIHRSIFEEVGGFDVEMRSGEDTNMWERIALRYPEMGYCRTVCWRYHGDNSNSASHKASEFRDLQLRRLCENMRHGISLGPDIADLMRPYARMRVVDHLIRGAGRECFIDPRTIEEAGHLFPLTVRERSLLRILRSLPKPLARRAMRRFTI